MICFSPNFFTISGFFFHQKRSQWFPLATQDYNLSAYMNKYLNPGLKYLQRYSASILYIINESPAFNWILPKRKHHCMPSGRYIWITMWWVCGIHPGIRKFTYGKAEASSYDSMFWILIDAEYKLKEYALGDLFYGTVSEGNTHVQGMIGIRLERLVLPTARRNIPPSEDHECSFREKLDATRSLTLNLVTDWPTATWTTSESPHISE